VSSKKSCTPAIKQDVFGLENIFSFEEYNKEKEEEIKFSKNKTIPKVVNQEEIKIGRNEPCPCNSGKKYKKCCMPD